MKTTFVLSTLVAFCLAAPVRAEDLADQGRAVFKKNQQTVVTVELVVKMKFSMSGGGGQNTETQQDATGTVIDPSGLTVLSLSATDPSAMVQSMMGGMAENSGFKMDTELSDLKILLEDGTELPAEVVLRDKDLDLAFIRPKTKPAADMPAVDLSQAGKADVLDQVISLTRLGNVAGRAYAASVERISAIVEKPRLFYVPETSATTTSLGSPAFTLAGKPLGIFVMRTAKSKSAFPTLRPESVAGIILPAADVLKAAKQAPPAGAAAPEAKAASDTKKEP